MEVEGTEEVEAIPGATEGLRQLFPKHRFPQWKTTPQILPRDGQTPPAPCNQKVDHF